MRPWWTWRVEVGFSSLCRQSILVCPPADAAWLLWLCLLYRLRDGRWSGQSKEEGGIPSALMKLPAAALNPPPPLPICMQNLFSLSRVSTRPQPKVRFWKGRCCSAPGASGNSRLCVLQCVPDGDKPDFNTTAAPKKISSQPAESYVQSPQETLLIKMTF